jgi:hypothetical protein
MVHVNSKIALYMASHIFDMLVDFQSKWLKAGMGPRLRPERYQEMTVIRDVAPARKFKAAQ